MREGAALRVLTGDAYVHAVDEQRCKGERLGMSPVDAAILQRLATARQRALQRWVTVPEPPLPWLLLVTRRLATDRWRRARRLAGILLAGRRRAAIDGAEARSEFWAWYDAVSAVLTLRQREVLALRYQHDLTDEQIGAVMGLTASGVRSLVARAIDALRAHPEVL